MFRWRGWHRLQVTFVFAANCIQLELNIQGKKARNCGFLWGGKFFCQSSFDSLTLGYPCLVPGVVISAWTPLPNPDGGNWLAGSDSQNQTLCRTHRFATWKNIFYFFVLNSNFTKLSCLLPEVTALICFALCCRQSDLGGSCYQTISTVLNEKIWHFLIKIGSDHFCSSGYLLMLLQIESRGTLRLRASFTCTIEPCISEPTYALYIMP